INLNFWHSSPDQTKDCRPIHLSFADSLSAACLDLHSQPFQKSSSLRTRRRRVRGHKKSSRSRKANRVASTLELFDSSFAGFFWGAAPAGICTFLSRLATCYSWAVPTQDFSKLSGTQTKILQEASREVVASECNPSVFQTMTNTRDKKTQRTASVLIENCAILGVHPSTWEQLGNKTSRKTSQSQVLRHKKKLDESTT